MKEQTFCLKLQLTDGDPAKVDCRGGEPDDFHVTLQAPGRAGMEIEGIPESELPRWLKFAERLNAALALFRVGGLGGFAQKLRVMARIMDSDGKSGIQYSAIPKDVLDAVLGK